MSFLQAIKLGFHRIFDFNGRACRAEYWYWALFLSIPCRLLLYLILSIVILPLGVGTTVSQLIGQLIGDLIIIVLLIPIAFRRLHDINKSGWYYILWSIGSIPFAIMISFSQYSFQLPFSPYLLILSLGLFVGVVIWFLLWFCRKGDKGDNRYGPDPLAQNEEGAV